MLTAVLIAFVSANDTASAQSAVEIIVPPSPGLQTLINEAAAANPSLEELRARLQAAEARIDQAGAWKDPKLSIGAMNLPATNPTDLNQEPMTGLWVNGNQSIPLNGKYGTRRDAAAAMAEAAREQLGLRAATVEEAVRDAWYSWAWLRESVATVDTTIGLVDDLIVVTRSSYETGRGLQSSLLRLQTERSQLASRQIELEQQARDAGRRLAILLGRTPENLPEPPDDLPVTFPDLNADELRDQLERAPHVSVAKEMVRANELKVRLAEQLWLPELTVGAGYGYRPDADNGLGRADFISVTAGLTLPVFGASKQGQAVEEAVATERAAKASLRETMLEVQRRLASLLDEDERHAAQIQLYNEGVLPQAKAALSSVLSDYSVARVDVDALIAAERELINARLQRLMHLRDRAKVRAAIAGLVYSQPVEIDPSNTEEN